MGKMCIEVAINFNFNGNHDQGQVRKLNFDFDFDYLTWNINIFPICPPIRAIWKLGFNI